ncbi:FRG domain-containing protein [Methanococcus maripaludis]|uniref:Sec-independent protein translocase protein TatA n=1 Tax=Methanococcus maripaludis TaxID=39152 RepID=A0A7J9SDY7_METMI|nr:FRG domain-containing protein [Methanococcus maripaludis]MBB6497776.1 Sec-independent protein translocase protein TatA [Methanococcus maripaludis]
MDLEIEINSVSELLDYLKDIEELSNLLRNNYIGTPEESEKNTDVLNKSKDLTEEILFLKYLLNYQNYRMNEYDLQKALKLINNIRNLHGYLKTIKKEIRECKKDQLKRKKDLKKLNKDKKHAQLETYNELKKTLGESIELADKLQAGLEKEKNLMIKEMSDNEKELNSVRSRLEPEIWNYNDTNNALFESYADAKNLKKNMDIKNAETSIKNDFVDDLIRIIVRFRDDIKEEIRNNEKELKLYENTLKLFKPEKDVLFYRGEKNSEWKLYPSLFRKTKNKDIYDYDGKECEFYMSLVELNHPEFKKQNNIFDKVAMMQHYSIPTRLLDWTKNPLVALYFAIEEYVERKDNSDKEELKDGKIYVYSPNNAYYSNELEIKILFEVFFNGNITFIEDILKLRIDGRSVEEHLHDLHDNELWYDNDRKLLELKKLITGIHLIRPIITNDRLRVQQGCFSVYGSIVDGELIQCNNVTDYDLESSNEILATFIIPADKKKEIREELERLGIHDGTMFPELDKYGEYLKKKYSN